MAIAGVGITKNSQPLAAGLMDRMLRRLALREAAVPTSISTAEVMLGSTSETGAESLWQSQDLWVACDADLVGLQDDFTASELSAVGAAEAIAILYLRHGIDFLKRLRGAFSLALWDAHSETLLIAVDRFAVKPLTYFADDRQLVFASQPRGIFASGRVEKQVNSVALASFLNFSVVPAPESAFRSLEKLPAGSFLSWQRGKVHIERYWDLQYSESRHSTINQLADELLSGMSRAVGQYSQDVRPDELGCFLSGGTDSSSILGLLTQQKKTSINALSIGFSEQRFNELEYARIAADAFHAKHSIVVLSPEETFKDIPEIVSVYDEPFGNSSAMPTYACLKLARDRGIKVMFAGDGGDELFGGNERYRTEQIFGFYRFIPQPLRRYLIEPVAFRSGTAGVTRKLRRYIEQSKTANPERYFKWLLLQVFPPARVLGPNIVLNNGHGDLLHIPRRYYRSAPANSELNRLLYIDIKMTLADNDLPKVARTAELAGVKVRFPYLDHPLADFSGALPVNLKVRGLEKRYLFKKATANLLPKEILRKKKHGFGLPIGMWLKQHPLWRGHAEDVLLDPRTYQRGYFQRAFVEELFKLMDADNSTYYGDLLWLFLVAELWHRRHLEVHS